MIEICIFRNWQYLIWLLYVSISEWEGKQEKLFEDYLSLRYAPQEIVTVDREHLLSCFLQTFTFMYQIALNMEFEIWKGLCKDKHFYLTAIHKTHLSTPTRSLSGMVYWMGWFLIQCGRLETARTWHYRIWLLLSFGISWLEFQHLLAGLFCCPPRFDERGIPFSSNLSKRHLPMQCSTALSESGYDSGFELYRYQK